MPPTARTLVRERNLRNQIDELRHENDQEVVFRETSPAKEYITLYSRLDGEPVEISLNIAQAALRKRLPDGSYLFTDDPTDAPPYKKGEVKCFLHADSAERMAGLLDEVGLASFVCPAGSLANLYSKRIHALHRHKQQWAALDEYQKEQKERAAEARQEQQLQATLALVGGGKKAKPE